MTDLTYAEIGATRAAVLPGGYHHLRRRTRLSTGPGAYLRAVTGLRTWAMQRGAGLRIPADTPEPAVGVRMVASVLGLRVPCEVVWVVDEERRYGYGYGTLPGHPEEGEEAFVVTLDDDGVVWLEVVAFSRPGRWYTRLAGPLAQLVQALATARYVAVVRRIARGLK
jgi:uncharacterized protein (UPF0548 family)